MANVGIYLDTRRANSLGQYPLKLRVKLLDGVLMVSLNRFVATNQWSGQQVVRHEQKTQINHLIRTMLNRVEDFLIQRNDWTRESLREAILTGKLYRDKTLVKDVFEKKIAASKARKTKEAYLYTLSTIGKYTDISRLTFEDIDHNWLQGFGGFLSKKSVNTQSVHLRNIRGVYNEAISSKLVSLGLYPFRGFKIKSEETFKRNLTIDELRYLRDYDCEKCVERYRDYFLLMFFLIGINLVDLLHLKEVRNGRIEYRRAKVGTLLSIKVEPEAMRIIEKYKGKKYLLDAMDNRVNYHSFLQSCNKGLSRIGKVDLILKRCGSKMAWVKVREPAFPDLTTYWSRHTWATIAADLDIPKETIAAALGHRSGSVTDIYINFNRKKIDAANRQVLDYLKSGK